MLGSFNFFNDLLGSLRSQLPHYVPKNSVHLTLSHSRGDNVLLLARHLQLLSWKRQCLQFLLLLLDFVFTGLGNSHVREYLPEQVRVLLILLNCFLPQQSGARSPIKTHVDCDVLLLFV